MKKKNLWKDKLNFLAELVLFKQVELQKLKLKKLKIELMMPYKLPDVLQIKVQFQEEELHFYMQVKYLMILNQKILIKIMELKLYKKLFVLLVKKLLIIVDMKEVLLFKNYQKIKKLTQDLMHILWNMLIWQNKELLILLKLLEQLYKMQALLQV